MKCPLGRACVGTGTGATGCPCVGCGGCARPGSGPGRGGSGLLGANRWRRLLVAPVEVVLADGALGLRSGLGGCLCCDGGRACRTAGFEACKVGVRAATLVMDGILAADEASTLTIGALRVGGTLVEAEGCILTIGALRVGAAAATFRLTVGAALMVAGAGGSNLTARSWGAEVMAAAT